MLLTHLRRFSATKSGCVSLPCHHSVSLRPRLMACIVARIVAHEFAHGRAHAYADTCKKGAHKVAQVVYVFSATQALTATNSEGTFDTHAS